MAKHDDDDFDFDDFDDLDFGDDPPYGAASKDRNPVLETVRAARKSAIDAVIPKHQRAQLIVDGLPKPAGDLYENAKDLEYAASDVLAHTKEELVKTQRRIKTQTRQMIPTLRKYLPDLIVDPVQKWSKGEDYEFEQRYDPQQAMLDRGMDEVFGPSQPDRAQAAREEGEAQDQQIEAAAEDRLRETVRDIRSDKIHETVAGIYGEISAISTFTRGINVNFQKKLLELNYRQMFALQDIAAISKSAFDRNAPALEAIVKNTSLPDYAKEEFGEITAANMKRKVAQWISPANYMDGFVSNFQERLKQRITSVLGQGAGILGAVMDMGTEDDFDLESTGSLGADGRKENLKNKGVGIAASALAKRYINPHRDKLLAWSRSELEDRPEFVELLNRGKYLTGNVSAIAASSLAGERNDGLGDFFRIARDFGLVDGYRREELKMEERSGDYLSKAAKLDNRTYITLNEIIPTELREIRRAVLKTIGEEDNRVYDITSRGYVDQDVIGNRVRKHIGADDLRDRQRKQINNIIDIIGEKDFTTDERAAIGKFFEDRISTGKELNVKQLIENPEIVNRYMGFETGAKFINVLTGRSDGGDQAFGLTNEINDQLNALRRSVTSYQQRAEEARSIYGDAGLMASRLFKYDDKTDRVITDPNVTNIYRDVGTVDKSDFTTGKEKEISDRIRQHLKKGSATADLLRRNFTEEGVESNSVENVINKRRHPKARDNIKAGKFNFKLLREVLYGKENTNFTDLLRNNPRNGSVLNETTFKPVTDGLTSIVDILRKNSVHDEVVKILEHVRSIDEDGVLLATLASGKESVKGENETTDKKGKKSKKAKRKHIKLEGDRGLLSRWFGVVGDTAQGGWNMAKGAASTVAGWGRGLRERIGPREGFFKDAAFGTGGFIKDGFMAGLRGAGAFGKAVIGARDIYDSSGEVVLNGHKLKNGQYYIKDGEDLKAIYTIEDIGRGPIYDKEGNIVLTEDAIAKAGELSFYKDKRWWKLTEVLGGGLGSLINKGLKLPSASIAGVGNVLKAGKDWFTTYPDMYVPGEKTPRIRGKVLREGGYRLRKTGKVVYKPADFTGEIETVDGGHIVISEEEYANPSFKLITRWGNTIETPLGRIGRRIGKIASFGIRAIAGLPGALSRVKGGIRESRAGKWAKDKLTNNFVTRWWKGDPSQEGGTGWFRNNFNNFISLGLGGNGVKTNDVLIRIYKLLNKRMKGTPESEDWLDAMASQKGMVSKAAGSVRDTVKASLKKSRRRTEALKRLRRMQGKKSFTDEVAEKFAKKKRRAAALNRLRRMQGKRHVSSNFTDKLKPFASKTSHMLKYGIGNNAKAWNKILSKDNTDGQRDFYVDLAKRNATAKLKNSFKLNLSDDTRTKLSEKLDGLSAKERRARVNAKLAKRRLARAGGKKLRSTQELLTDLLNINEMSWFNRMRKDAEDGEVPQGKFRAMLGKFAKRVKFDKDGERRDYFRWFRNGRKKREDGEVADKPKGESSFNPWKRWKPDSLLGKAMKMLVGGALSIVGGVLKGGFGLGKWMLGGILNKAVIPLAVKAGGLVASVATGIVAAVGWPALVAGAVVGGAGWVVYKAATRKRAYYLDKLRLAQYGLRDYDLWSSDDGAKTLFLEDSLKPFTTYDGQGRAVLRGLNLTEVNKLAEGYGLDIENQTEMLTFHAYMQQRFIPLYLWWLTGTRKAESSPALADLGNSNKVSKEGMLSIFNHVKRNADDPLFKPVKDPRNVDRGMFKRAWDWVTFTNPDYLTGEEVAEVTKQVEAEINARRSVKPKRQVSKEVVAVTAVTDTFERIASVDASNKETMKEDYARDGKNVNDVKIDYIAPFVEKIEASESTLTALQSLRYKVYGLTTLNERYVTRLKAFEDMVLPNINRNTGAYEGDLNSALKVLGVADNQLSVARMWFRFRFLPVYATYVLACKRYAPMANPNRLINSGSYLHEIGLLLERVIVERSGVKTSVWSILEFPFDAAVNTDPSTISDELKTLEDISKTKDLTVRNLLKDIDISNKPIFARDKKRGSMVFTTNDDETLRFNNVTNNASMSAIKPTGQPWSNSDTSSGSPIGRVEAKPGSYLSVKTENDDIPSIIREAAKVAGISPLLALTVAQMESSLNPNARPAKGSAKGLFQFIDSTWEEMLRRHGNKYGIPDGTPPTDPVAASLLGAEYLKGGSRVVESIKGSNLSAADYYIPHFLGPGGARKFYDNLMKNPNRIAADVLPAEARNNPRVFYNTDGSPRTFSEVYRAIHQRMASSESYVRKYSGVPERETNVTDLFSNLPNEQRRGDAIRYSAVKESENIANDIEYNTGAMPDGSKMPVEVTDVVKPVSRSVEKFQKTNPTATKDEVQTYREELTDKVVNSNVIDIKPIITSSETNTAAITSVLERQYGVQEDILAELRLILKTLLGKIEGRDVGQEVRGVETREVVAKQRKSLVIEHGTPLINTKRVRTM